MFDFIRYLRTRWAGISQASGQRGTFVDELATQPTGIIMREFYNSMVSARRVNDIDMWRGMTEEELDRFGNKFFIPRVDGARASGHVTIYLDDAINFEIDKNVDIIGENKFPFGPAQPIRVSKSLLQPSDEPYAVYEYTFPVVAKERGMSGNLESGEIREATGLGIAYKFITNKKPITGGLYRENNEEYVKRLYYALNDRSMSNVRSIIATLPEFFPVIRNIYVAGAGDKYMNRDLVYGVTDKLQEISFLGKTPGSSLVQHLAIPDFFPPRPGTRTFLEYPPFTQSSAFSRPLAIAPIVTDSENEESEVFAEDPALNGVNLSYEASSEQYSGVYFKDDFRTMDIETGSLYDVFEDGFEGFLVGTNRRPSGVFGQLMDGATEEDSPIRFNGTQINLSPHTKRREAIVAMKRIGKRGGVKLTGSFQIPVNDIVNGSTLQIGVAGDNSVNPINAFTGIGFGVHPIEAFTPSEGEEEKNTAIFIYCGTEYNEEAIYTTQDFFQNGTTASDSSALIEKLVNLERGEEYEFEFILDDTTENGNNEDRDFSVSLIISPVTVGGVDIRLPVPPNAIRPFKHWLLYRNSEYFGENLKISLAPETPHKEDWIVSGLVADDLSRSHAQVMIAMDTGVIRGGAEIVLSAFGFGSMDGSGVEGINTFIWNPNGNPLFTPTSDLNSGNWQKLPQLSGNSARSITDEAVRKIDNIEPYKLGGAFDNKIVLLIQSKGTSRVFRRFNNDPLDNIEAILRVGYIGLRDKLGKYYHSNSEADVYVTTFGNTESLPENTVSITKTSGSGFFELSRHTGFNSPVFEIINVSSNIGGVTSQIPAGSYSTSYADNRYRGSTKEVMRISLEDDAIDTITVTYSYFPKVEDMQYHFSESQYRQTFGGYLARHAHPCNLEIFLNYTGFRTPEEMDEIITEYIDTRVTTVFSRDEFVRHLHENNYISSIAEGGLQILYQKLDDDFNIESGEINEEKGFRLEIRPIDFFHLRNVQSVRM